MSKNWDIAGFKNRTFSMSLQIVLFKRVAQNHKIVRSVTRVGTFL